VRSETRRQRYNEKAKSAKKYPISICAINFRVDDNLGYLVRSAACFGAQRIHVIGHVPVRSVLKSPSGSLIDYVEVVQHTRPSDFLLEMQEQKTKIISAELVGGAKPLSSYDFTFDSDCCVVVGNEESGVPVEILRNSENIYIPMPGVGFCLNTAQAANIILYEAVKQYEERKWIAA